VVEVLHGGERPLDPSVRWAPAAHGDQQPERHAGEAGPRICPGGDHLYIGGGPPGLGGHQVEFFQQGALPDTTQPRVDELGS
jgi:hypothetical protein